MRIDRLSSNQNTITVAGESGECLLKAIIVSAHPRQRKIRMENEQVAATSLTKLYVGSLPYSWTAEQLEELFQSYGRITSAAIVSDQVTRKSKGFGFIEFEA